MLSEMVCEKGWQGWPPFLEAKKFFRILKKNRVAPTPAKFGGFGSKA